MEIDEETAAGKQPPTRKVRAVWLLVGILSLFVTMYSLANAPRFGITPLVFGVITLAAAVAYLAKFAGYQVSVETLPKSLQKVSTGYVIFLMLWWLVGVVMLVIEWEASSLGDFAAIFGLGFLSVTVWGTVVCVLVVLPLWYLWKLVSKDADSG